VNQQRDLDKVLLGLVRIAALQENEDRALEYIQMMTYTKVMRIAVKLCENLNAKQIASRILAYVQEREQQDIYNEKKTPQIVEKKQTI